MKNIKADFPIFANHPELIYLDSASTLQKPQVVIDAVSEYLSNDYANIHRGTYELSQRSEHIYEQSRSTIADFIGANDESELVFTANSTDSVNLLARSLFTSNEFEKGDNIILTELEHHANLLPWQMIAEMAGVELRWIPVGLDGVLNLEKLKKSIDSNTKIIALSACSNVTGRVWLEEVKQVSRRLDGGFRDDGSGTPLSPSETSPLGRGEKDSPLAPLREGGTRLIDSSEDGSLSSREDGFGNPSAFGISPYRGRGSDRLSPLVIVDASQAVVHAEIDVNDLGCDFLFFTGHKLGALTGIGVLRGKQEHLKRLTPGKAGGGAIEQVTQHHTSVLGSPDKFEPGTPNVVGALSLAKAIEYVEKEIKGEREKKRGVGTQYFASDDIGSQNLATDDEKSEQLTSSNHEGLIQYCLDEFRILEDGGKITLLGGYDAKKKIGLFSFIPHGVDIHALDKKMAAEGIALRVGAHCTHIYHAGLSDDPSCMLEKTCRISFWEYNEIGELERFFEVLRSLLK